MARFLRISPWNVNDPLTKSGITSFVFTEQNYFHFRGYSVYITNHPDGKTHGNTSKHCQISEYMTDNIQRTSIKIHLILSTVLSTVLPAMWPTMTILIFFFNPEYSFNKTFINVSKNEREASSLGLSAHNYTEKRFKGLHYR